YHHALFDGWSTPLVFTELLSLYRHGGAADALPPVRPYSEFLHWLSRQDHEQAVTAWRTYLTGLEGPLRLSPPGAPSSEPASCSRFDVDVDEVTTSRLGALTRQFSVTLNTIVEATWAVLLGRLTGRDDVVFGRTVSGRPANVAGVERMIGLFINTVPVRVRLRPGQTFSSLVREIQQSQSDLREVEHVGLAEIQRLAGVDSLFDTLLVFENYPLDRRALSDAASELMIVRADGRDAAHYPLTLVIAPGERLHVRVDYDPDR